MNKFVLGILFPIILAGCTSTKIIQPQETNGSFGVNNQDAKIGIVAKNLPGKTLVAGPGLITLNAVYGDAFIKSIQSALSQSFKTVAIINETDDKNQFDYLLYVDNNIRGVCGDSCTFYSETPFVIKNTKSNFTLMEQKVDDVFFWTRPTAVKVLAIVSGLTIIPLPITGPIMTDMCGEELANVVAQSNTNVASKVATTILSNKEFRK